MNIHVDAAIRDGVRNLFFDCGGCEVGDQVLIIHEAAGDGFYDPQLAPTVAHYARDLGLSVSLHSVPFSPDVHDPDPSLCEAMERAECSVFIARLGDQIRFRAQAASQSQVICYALDRDVLASGFGRTPFQQFEDLKLLINIAMSCAEDIHVTCPLGTDFRGKLEAPLQPDMDVTRKRFPMTVFAPLVAAGFAGRIAQKGFLTGTGSCFYTPYTCEIEDVLLVNFDGYQITGFDGTDADMTRAQAHYARVGEMCDVDPWFIHSWHAGIHPGLSYNQTAAQSFERWSNGAFGNPRLLHFHSCGASPLGEISLNLLDPTIRLDGVSVWENGRLYPERIHGGAALLDKYPEMRALFDAPCQNVGQGADGGLCFE